MHESIKFTMIWFLLYLIVYDIGFSSAVAVAVTELPESLCPTPCVVNAECSDFFGDKDFVCRCLNGFRGDGSIACKDVDECKDRDCSDNATCTNTIGSFKCTCKDGYSGDGFHACDDVNECFDDNGGCDDNALCVNNIGSFKCSCNGGYSGNGFNCADINECITNNGGCHNDAQCTNNQGSFTCRCNNGYIGNGFDCKDVNECQENNGGCDNNAQCANNPGSFECMCNSGYIATGSGLSCTDINECNTSNGGCDNDAQCINRPGSFECTCNNGYNGNGFSCTDINECNTNNGGCNSNARCINKPGSFKCACNDGFTGSGLTCTDINECNTSNGGCDNDAQCTNNQGSFTCRCNNGYIGNGFDCKDINECLENNGGCDNNAECTNNQGSFECTCNNGYNGNGFTCFDMNECEEGNGGCDDVRGICSNTDGSFSCSCASGFTGDGVTCPDVDECDLDLHNCDGNAQCTNTNGHYICTCKSGYNGDGVTCEDNDECAILRGCDVNANCSNKAGSFECTCRSGFNGTGFICTDIDECEVNNDACDVNARCINNPGSFTCACNDGFTGSGLICTDVNECKMNNGGCDDNAQCTNSMGSFACTCGTGYFRHDFFNCTDIDECTLCNGGCHNNSQCTNRPGSFECTCNNGYNGNGFNCTDINECSTNNGRCNTNARCINTPGSFTCKCAPGYYGNGFSCSVKISLKCQGMPNLDRLCCGNKTDTVCRSKEQIASAINDGAIALAEEFCEDDGIYFCCHGYQCSKSDYCQGKNDICGPNSDCYSRLDGHMCECRTGYRQAQTNDQNCLSSTICSKMSFKSYSFGETNEGNIAYASSRCPNNPDLPRAALTCIKSKRNDSSGTADGATFDTSAFHEFDCNSTVDTIASQFLTGPITSRDLQTNSFHLRALTANSTLFRRTTTRRIANFMETARTEARQGNVEISFDTLRSMAEVSSRLAGAKWVTDDGDVETTVTEDEKRVRQVVVQSMSTLARLVQLSETQNNFSLTTDVFVIQVSEDYGSGFQSIDFQPNLDGFSPVQVVIPTQAVERAWSSDQTSAARRKREIAENRRSTFLFYRDNSLFISDKNVTWVLSVELGVNASLANLSDPIRIVASTSRYGKTPVGNHTLQQLKTTLECVYWDFDLEDWSTDGCCLNHTADPPECLCNHLTNFAIIVNSKNVLADLVLDVVSDIGCILSVIGLTITMLVHLVVRDVRKRRPAKILLQICANLCIANLVFVAGVSNALGSYHGCLLVTSLLHYFFLVTWCWMSIYSYDLYMSVVKVFREDFEHFLFCSSAIAYLLPAAITGVTAGIGIGYFDQIQSNYLCGEVARESSYRAEHACWLQGNFLFFGFLLPVGFMLVCNCVVFVAVFWELTGKKKTVRSTALRRTNMQTLSIAVTMTSIMGITWIFGYFVLISDDPIYVTIMSWIFAIFNTLQGFAIFILTCVRRSDMRHVLLYPIRSMSSGASSVMERFRSSRKQSTTDFDMKQLQITTESSHVTSSKENTYVTSSKENIYTSLTVD